MNLDDNYQISGKDFDSFQTAVNELVASTKDVKIPGCEAVILSPCVSSKMQKAGEIPFYVLSQAYEAGFAENGKLHLGYKKAEEVYDSDKMPQARMFLIMFQGNTYSVSPMAFQTLSQRAGVGGEDLATHNTLARDMYLSECLHKQNEKIRFVYREDTTSSGVTLKKIFAAFGSMYTPSPQTALTETILNLQFNNDIVRWDISHQETIVTMYAGKERKCGTHKLRPVLTLTASDIGKGTTGIKTSIWMDGRPAFIVGQKNFVHKREITSVVMTDKCEEMLEDLQQEVELFCETLPQRVVYNSDVVELLRKAINLPSLSGKRVALLKELNVLGCENQQLSWLTQLDDFVAMLTSYDIQNYITNTTEWYENLYIIIRELVSKGDEYEKEA